MGGVFLKGKMVRGILQISCILGYHFPQNRFLVSLCLLDTGKITLAPDLA